MKFVDTMVQYLRAGFPALYVTSHEETRVEADLMEVAKKTGRNLWSWSVTKGWVSAEPGHPQAANLSKITDPSAALGAITNALPEQTILVAKDFHPFLVDTPEGIEIIRKVRDLTGILKSTSRTLVFLSPKVSIPLELEKEITVVPFNLPNREELTSVLDGVIDSAGGSKKIGEVEDRVALLEAAKGLTVAEAENAFALAVVRHKAFDVDSITTVRNEKAGVIKKTNLMTWVEPSVTTDQIGGLGNVKADLETMKPIFHHPDKAEEYGFLPEDFPRSIAFVGVPGTGKSLMAEAVARLLHVGCVQTDFGRMFGSKVGESEGNILRRNELVESMAPVVDWWDEAEKGLAGIKGSDQNPWEARVGASILTWFEQFRSRVLVVATINRVEALPAEMISRFQRVYFVDLPNEDERVEIFGIHLGKRSIKVEKTQLTALAMEADGFNGREIRNSVQAAMQMAFSAGEYVEYKHVSAALKTITPLSVTREEDIRRIRDWAKKHNVRPASAARSEKRPVRGRRMEVSE